MARLVPGASVCVDHCVAVLERGGLAWSAWLVLSLGCTAHAPSNGGNAANGGAPSIAAEAGFLDLAPRNVFVHGRAVSLSATSKIFYNFRPADTDADTRPLIVLF